MTDEVKPEDIAPVPAGRNTVTATPRDSSLDERTELTFIAGQSTRGFDLLSDMVLQEYPRGTRMTITREQARMIESWAQGRIHGYQMSLQMVCVGDKCPYHKVCPIVKAGLQAPVTHPCPWEGALFKVWVANLCNELKVNPNDYSQYTDYNTIRELCAVELIMGRVAMEIALYPRNVHKEIRGVDPATGQYIYGEEVNKRYDRLHSLQAQKLKLLQSLSATRQEKLKAGAETGMDAATYLSELARQSRGEIVIDMDAKTIETDEQPPSPSEVLESEPEYVEIDDDEQPDSSAPTTE